MEHIQDLLHPVVARLLRQGPFSEEKLQCAWRMAVGADLARVSRVSAAMGVITVAFDDGRWLKELDRSHGLILERLQAVLGPDVVKQVAFTVPTTPATQDTQLSARRPHGRRQSERTGGALRPGRLKERP